MFTYVVGPGPRSTFVANYTPLAVVYHLDASQTDVRLKNTGDLLGPGPQPLFDLDAIDAAAGGVHVFVGWTEANPGAGGYAIGDASTSLVGPSDPVSRPTELWPVYRPIGATAASNIDAELAAGGIDPASVRSVGRADGGLVVQAGDAAGYQFAGWYRDYADAANPGTLVSAAATFSLDASQAFDPVAYTAVYEAVHELRYHDTPCWTPWACATTSRARSWRWWRCPCTTTMAIKPLRNRWNPSSTRVPTRPSCNSWTTSASRRLSARRSTHGSG